MKLQCPHSPWVVPACGAQLGVAAGTVLPPSGDTSRASDGTVGACVSPGVWADVVGAAPKYHPPF